MLNGEINAEELSSELSKKRFEQSIRRILHLGRIALSAATGEHEVNMALSSVGYDENVLRSGLALLDETETIVRDHWLRFPDAYDPTAAVHAAREEADAAFSRTLIITRVALKNDHEAEIALRFACRHPVPFPAWSSRADGFYRTLLGRADWLDCLGRFCLTRPELENGSGLVNHAAVLYDRQWRANTRDSGRNAWTRWRNG